VASGAVTVLADPTGPSDPTDPTGPIDPSGPVTPGNPSAGSPADGFKDDRGLASTGTGAVWPALLVGLGALALGGSLVVWRRRSVRADV
jgi:LPXTG-motif cell wall-anchored protein